MNAIITRCRQVMLAATVLVAVNISAVEPEKCKPCAAVAAARLSAAAAAAAAINAGKPISREMELDIISADTGMVEACCAFCAQIGSLGCQGENSARCNVCQAGLIKISIAEAAAAALALANTVVNKRRELDPIPSVRAPREELADPCNTCDTVVDDSAVCDLNCKLQAIFNCCVNTNQQVRCQGHEFNRCCKKLRHDIDDVEDLVESQIDQSIECCSIIETTLGSGTSLAIPVPTCAEGFTITDFVNNTDIDVIAWLKSLYILLYTVYNCACSPCIE